MVLLDITMPALNGLEVTARLARTQPRTRVLILSMHREPEYVAQALRSGASGYLLKDSSGPELEVAVRAAARGDLYLSPAISQPVIEGYVSHAVGSVADGPQSSGNPLLHLRFPNRPI